jgi:hypothetical protein
MKKIYITCSFILISFFSFAQFTEIPSGRFTGFPYAFSQDSGLNPSLCDTLNYTLRLMEGTLSQSKLADSGSINANDTMSRASRIYSVNRIDSTSDHITGSPFAYFIQYQSGNDSAWMFKVFTDVIMKTRDCLSNGMVQEADAFWIHDPEYGRKIRYEYVIKKVKPGISPALNNAIITIQFYPDTRGVISDKFVLYRVDMVIHP